MWLIPLCLLHLPSALAIHCASLKGGCVLLLAPSGWVRRIQLSVAVRVGIRSNFSFSSRPDQLMTVCCGVAISSPQILSLPLPTFLNKGGMVRAVSSWYLVAWKTSFTVRNIFQANDLSFLSLSSLSCRVNLFCKLAPSALDSEFTRVCLRRCHCAPSSLRGPDGRWIVAMPCVVAALMRPAVVSQDSGLSNIRTAPTPGGFLNISKMSLFSRFLSFRVSGSLDACGTENLSLSSFGCLLSACSSYGSSPPHE